MLLMEIKDDRVGAGMVSVTDVDLSHDRLRRTPEVVFLEDSSLERGDRMLHLLDHIKSDRPPEDDDSAISDQ